MKWEKISQQIKELRNQTTDPDQKKVGAGATTIGASVPLYSWPEELEVFEWAGGLRPVIHYPRLKVQQLYEGPFVVKADGITFCTELTFIHVKGKWIHEFINQVFGLITEKGLPWSKIKTFTLDEAKRISLATHLFGVTKICARPIQRFTQNSYR